MRSLNFRTLDLNLLRVFDVVMSEHSLTRAATQLAMTQPAVSHALKRLHDAVGEALFVRSSHGMRPTPRAEALWPQVRSALSGLQQALAPTEFDPCGDAVSFRLAMVDATAVLLMPGLVQAIETTQAQVNLRVLPLATRDPRGLLERGDADLAVGHFPDALAAIVAEGDEAVLRHRRLYDTRYVCVMRAGHPLAQGPLTLDAYCEAHHLLVSFSGKPHGFIDQSLSALGRRRRIVLTVNQFFTAGEVVTGSDLLTVLPQSFLSATGYQQELVVRELPFEVQRVQVEMMWHRRRDADPAHRWLRERIVATHRAVPDPAPVPPGG
ncbi:LysR family transcriptional regulator [Ideonella livida]|uniref:LysR family transcriptional regulator n=1 Tax=Ideonella livida TaxID=2707176 RepID=A0A7C9TLI5_9BURK|nr:LysR family transcriptional regulator [Ideonella livida]NDY90986.1 LysR family transcriptional regulator [Ideonella livida]